MAQLSGAAVTIGQQAGFAECNYVGVSFRSGKEGRICPEGLCRGWRECSSLQQLARIHQVLWIQRRLDLPHQSQFQRVLVAWQFVPLMLPYAMLGTD